MPAIIRGIFGGGGKIKDATATPQDVMTGKVFYNNDGRQVGLKNEAIKGLKVFNLSIPKKLYSGDFIDVTVNSHITHISHNDENLVEIQYETTYRCIKYQDFKFNRILGFEINGNLIFDDNKNRRMGKAFRTDTGSMANDHSSGMLDFSIIFVNNGIYIGHETYQQITDIEPDIAHNLKVYYV